MITSLKFQGLEVKGLGETADVHLPSVYLRDSIVARKEQIPATDTAKRWPHLKDVAMKLEAQPKSANTEIGLLISINCPRAFIPRAVVAGEEDDPYAMRTGLGWGIVGLMGRPDSHSNTSGQNNVLHFTFRTQVREMALLDVDRLFNQVFNANSALSENQFSQDNRKFLQKAEQEYIKGTMTTMSFLCHSRG